MIFFFPPLHRPNTASPPPDFFFFFLSPSAHHKREQRPFSSFFFSPSRSRQHSTAAPPTGFFFYSSFPSDDPTASLFSGAAPLTNQPQPPSFSSIETEQPLSIFAHFFDRPDPASFPSADLQQRQLLLTADGPTSSPPTRERAVLFPSPQTQGLFLWATTTAPSPSTVLVSPLISSTTTGRQQLSSPPTAADTAGYTEAADQQPL